MLNHRTTKPFSGKVNKIKIARDVLDPYGTLELVDAARSVKLQQQLYFSLLKEIYEVSSGEKQVAPNDTDGMAWIARLIKPYVSQCARLPIPTPANTTLTTCKYWIVADGKDTPPLAMFRNEFDATQWQYLQCPTGSVESFNMVVKT